REAEHAVQQLLCLRQPGRVVSAFDRCRHGATLANSRHAHAIIHVENAWRRFHPEAVSLKSGVLAIASMPDAAIAFSRRVADRAVWAARAVVAGRRPLAHADPRDPAGHPADP